jgi:acylphosphatase
MAERARANVIISGRVQGVFFRLNTVRAAERIGVSGWVRNRPDGTVEAVVEGEKDNVDAMVRWCRTGDPPAKVSTADVDWQPYTGEFSGFNITH